MRAPLVMALLLLVSCGGAGVADRASTQAAPPTAASTATTAPGTSQATTGVAPAPAADPIGPSIRLSDGHRVVAVDPATGGVRATWPEAAISLEGDWTVAVDDGAARWIDPAGGVDRSAPAPAGLRPTITDPSGRWAVLAPPAPAVAPGEIGAARTTSHFVLTDGTGVELPFTLDGNFVPEAFGWMDGGRPMALQMIEYLPAAHPTRYRVRTLDLTTGTVGLPVNLQDKATPVDDNMAGTGRTQAYAGSNATLYTLYQPAESDPEYSTWEYGFVHTLATPYAGVFCIDLPEALGLTGHTGTLALSPDEQTLYVVTSVGRLGVVRTAADVLAVTRTSDLGQTSAEPPVMVAGSDHLWVGMGHRLLVVDPTTLQVTAQAELPAAVTALALDPTTHELLAADATTLRRWALGTDGQLIAASTTSLPSGLGPVTRIVR